LKRGLKDLKSLRRKQYKWIYVSYEATYVRNQLVYQTLHDIAPTPEAVRHVGAKARMIAESLLTGIWVHRDRDDPLAKKVELPDV